MSADPRAAVQETEAVAIGLGSNLGDRALHLRFGVRRLRRVLEDLRCSAVYETLPMHYDAQPLFLNACCIGRTRLSPRQLLSEMQDIERMAGRQRPGPRFGPRSLDLDLLLYGNLELDGGPLLIPHPRLSERAFVLVPLAEVAADWTVPGTAEREAATVAELLDTADRTGVNKTEIEL